MTKLQEFQSLLDSYPVLGGKKHDARFRREQERLFKKHYPRKRKVNWCLVSGTDEGKKLEEKYTRLAKAFHEHYREKCRNKKRAEAEDHYYYADGDVICDNHGWRVRKSVVENTLKSMKDVWELC